MLSLIILKKISQKARYLFLIDFLWNLVYDNLYMKIVVIGIGKVGETLIKNLNYENHDIVAIDVNSNAINKVVNRYDIKGMIGSGIERDVLIECGGDTADIVIACTSRDEVNVLTCVLAKKLGAKHTVARVRDPELFKEMGNIREVLGIDMAFNPEYRTAIEITQVLKFPSAKNVESFAGGKALMVEFLITENNPLVGKSLIDVAGFGFKILFGAVERGEEIIIPRGDFILKANDSVHIIATEAEITAFCKKLKIFKPRAKSVFIIGGGKVAYYLAKELCSTGVDVKIVEKDKEKCVALSSGLPKISVFLADGTDQSVLEEENLKGSDAVVTLTGMDESNVIISLYAKEQKVGKIITKIDRENVTQMVDLLGLDTVVSPKEVIANHIVRFVRARLAISSQGIKSLYKLNDKVEVVEFTVADDFIGKNTALKNLKIQKGMLIGGIVRGNEFILPMGDSELLSGDRVIVVVNAQKINELSDILR